MPLGQVGWGSASSLPLKRAWAVDGTGWVDRGLSWGFSGALCLDFILKPPGDCWMILSSR